MSVRSWMGLLVLFVALFAGIAYWSYAPPNPREDGASAHGVRPVGTSGLAPPELSVPPYHPRILYTSRALRRPAGLRRRVAPGGRLEPTFRYLRDAVLAYARNPTPLGDLPADLVNARLRALALCHLVDPQEPMPARAAVSLILAALDHPTIRNPQYDWRNFPVTEAMVFDWCYDVLAPPEREAFLGDMAKRGQYIAEIKNAEPPSALAPATALLPLAYLGLALAHEEGASERAEQWLTLFRERFCNDLLRPRFLTVGDGSGFALGEHETSDQIAIARVLRAWKLAVGEDLAALVAPAIPPERFYPAVSLSGWLGSMTPDFASDKCAAALVSYPPAPAELFYELDALTPGSLGAAFGDRVFSESWESLDDEDPARLLLALERIISDQSSEAPVAAVRLPSFAVLWLSGLLYHRGRLSDGSDLWLTLRAGSSPHGDHLHQNHVGIMRGGDPLAIDSGYGPAPDRLHRDAYFGSPFAHNTVVLSDLVPTEKGTFSQYSPGKLIWHFHDDTLTAGIGRVTIASPSDKAEFIRTVVVILNRYILICDAVLMHRAPGKAVWMMHSLDAPTIDGSSTLLEGKRAGGISESTDSHSFTITSGESELVFRTVYPEQPVMRIVGGDGYEFRAGNVNCPPAGGNPPIPSGELVAQQAGRYRIEIEHDRPGRRLYFIHLARCGPKGKLSLPEITPVDDPSAFLYYLRDETHVVKIAFLRSGQRVQLVVRDRATGSVISELVLGEP